MPANSAQAFRDGQQPQPLAQLAFRTYTDLNPVIGHQLAIQLPELAVPNKIESIRVNYKTKPTAMALSWMTPE